MNRNSAPNLRGRSDFKRAQRIIVKAGTGVLSRPDGLAAISRIANIVEQVGNRKRRKLETLAHGILVSDPDIKFEEAREGGHFCCLWRCGHGPPDPESPGPAHLLVAQLRTGASSFSW